MKLHLALSLRRALLAAALPVLGLAAQAETVTIGTDTTWDEETTLTAGDNYEITINTNWTIESGSFDIATSGVVQSVELLGATFTNKATLALSNTRDNNAYGLIVSSWEEWGMDPETREEVYVDVPSSVTNTGHLTASATSTTAAAVGIDIYGSTFVNSGVVNASATATGTASYVASNGLQLNFATFINEAEASLSASADGNTSSNSASIWLDNGSTLYNAGSLQADDIIVREVDTTLHLLDGSEAGALTKGTTMSIGGTNNATLSLGGVLANGASEDPANASVNKTGSGNGSTITLSSGLKVEKVNVTLADKVTLKLGGDLDLSAATLDLNNKVLAVDCGTTAHQVNLGETFNATVQGFVSGLGSPAFACADGTVISNGSIGGSDLTTYATGNGHYEFNNTTFSLDGTIALQDATLSGTSSISGKGTAMLTLNNVTLNVEKAADAPQTLADAGVLTLQVDMLQDLRAVSGTFTLDLSDWAEEINSGKYEMVTVNFSDSIQNFSSSIDISATWDGNETPLTGTLSGNSVSFMLPGAGSEGTAAIPEPTTATLSLLALAGLAARRRRK